MESRIEEIIEFVNWWSNAMQYYADLGKVFPDGVFSNLFVNKKLLKKLFVKETSPLVKGWAFSFQFRNIHYPDSTFYTHGPYLTRSSKSTTSTIYVSFCQSMNKTINPSVSVSSLYQLIN